MSGKVKNKLCAQLENILAVPDYYVYTDGIDIPIPASSTNVLPCVYFTMGTGFNGSAYTAQGDPYSHNDPQIMLKLAFLINTAANQSIKFSIEEWKLLHTIQNNSNSTVRIDAWCCEWRRDLPLNGGSFNSPLTLLGLGFLNNGKGGAGGTSNTYLLDYNSDPYQAADFVLQCKILKKKTRIITPGGTKAFRLKHSSPFMVHPNLLAFLAAGQTYATGQEIYDYSRGGRFWLFKLSTAQVQSTTNNLHTMGVVASSVDVKMITTLKWTYKFINNVSGTITEAGSGITSGAGMATHDIINEKNGQVENTTALT